LRILLTGKCGQVGSALVAALSPLGELTACDRNALDLASADSIRSAMREVRPQVIVNAAAYTAVDQAEREEALAFRINGRGPGILAEEAARSGALLVHFSTDYVFDGEKRSPYVETDAPNPLNAYGRSKLAGEQAVQASGCRHLTFRTSWVYAGSGNNFLVTMLRLAREGKPLRVVDDQHGAPTSSRMIAAATAEALGRLRDRPGLYHMSAAGSTTWCGFARAIFREAGISPRVTPIASHEYATAARRPRNCVLDNGLLARHAIRLPTWESGLREVLSTMT
jgi:dTDP-4-dehydrorhamnose reductase